MKWNNHFKTKLLKASSFVLLTTFSFSSFAATSPSLPVIEDFENGASGFSADLQGGVPISQATILPGGSDGGNFLRVTSFVNSDTGTIFECAQSFGCANFAGDLLANDVPEIFSFDIRHDADIELDIFVRFATPANFPGSTITAGEDIAAGQFETLSVELSLLNPLLVLSGPPGASNEPVLSNLGNFQIAVAGVPDDFEDVITFDLDQVTLTAVPVPAAVWLFGSALLGLVRFRKKEVV